MAKRVKKELTGTLVLINAILIVLILAYYGVRFTKAYMDAHKSISGESTNKVTLLVDEILSRQSYLDLTQGLVFNEKTNEYRYKGEITNNYLYYSGLTYRILGIDIHNNIIAVSDTSVTTMYTGLEKGFKDSYVDEWLNVKKEKINVTEKNNETNITENKTIEITINNTGLFSNYLYASHLLKSTDICEDIIDDPTKITCKEKGVIDKISTLSLYDYKEAGGKNSFLNNGEVYTLSTTDSNGFAYYITSDGSITLGKSKSLALGVKPVISIDYNTVLIKGNGEENNPFIIEEHKIEQTSDLYIGQYIKFDVNTSNENNTLFRVVGFNENGTKVAAVNPIEGKNGTIEKQFSKSTSDFDKTNKYNVAYYLNNDYLKEMDLKDFVIKSKWNINRAELKNLSYRSLANKTVEAEIGMLGLYDISVGDVKNVFTITRGITSSKDVIVVNESGNIYNDSASNKYGVRPSFYIRNDIKLLEGEGTLEKPYIIGKEIKDSEKEKED